MLEPPKVRPPLCKKSHHEVATTSATRSLVAGAHAQPKFKPVSLEGGPIIREVSRRNTGLETKRPHQWGPLGGYW